MSTTHVDKAQLSTLLCRRVLVWLTRQWMFGDKLLAIPHVCWRGGGHIDICDRLLKPEPICSVDAVSACMCELTGRD